MTVRTPRRPPNLPSLFPEGTVASRYAVRGVLGVGGTGTVFEALDEQTGEEVALKAIPRDETLGRRARREMRVAQTLDHPAIVRLLACAEDDDYLYVAFELVRGQDLAAAFRDGVLDDAGVLRAVAAVCDALAHAHERGVVHRDVKPGNVLLRDDGVLKLTDFGVALVDHPDATVDDRILGTLSYMAPEQVLGRAVTGATDVWAAALMAFEALTGENPFRARTPAELADRHAALAVSLAATRPDLPPAVQRVVDRALSPDPRRRPDAGGLRDALLAGARSLDRRQDGTATQALPLDRGPETARRLGALRRSLGARRPLRSPAGASAPPPGEPARPRHLRAVGLAAEAPVGQRARRLARAAARRLAGTDLAATGRPGTLRLAGAALSGLAAALLLGAVPFYPAGWPVALGALVAVVAWRAPRLAVALAALALLPAVGNLALGLVPAVALLLLVAALPAARAPRAVALPWLAVPAVALAAWPLLLAAFGRIRPAPARAALGGLAPLAVTVAAGLAGVRSPLSGEVPGAGLAARVAGSEDVVACGRALAEAAGSALPVQMATWALLALAAEPALRLHGPRLRLYAVPWLLVAFTGTALAPAALGAPAPPVLPAGVAVVLAAILVAVRSAVTAEPRARAAAPGSV